jgi:hypothetical protein
MALVVYDRVQETTTTSGTGSVTLLGAVSGFQSFAVVGNTNTTYYTITDGAQWEVGIGTYSTSGPTLARTTVLSNSNGNTTPITLSGGLAQVFVTYTAEKSVNLDASDNVTPLGTIASGTWQGTTVGVPYGGTGQTSYTDGQLLIGNTTGNTLTKASLTAGTGISITPGSGSISIASTVTSGVTITNDTTTATALYPTFTSATSGSVAGLNVTSTKLTFVPTTGSLTAPQTVASNGLVVNSNTVSASYSIPSGSSATSAGPMTVGSGVVVTVPSGSRWVVL